MFTISMKLETAFEKIHTQRTYFMTRYALMRDFWNYIRKQSYFLFTKRELTKYIQHGSTTIYKHTRNVSYLCFCFAKFLEKHYHWQFDYEALIIGAYLHDLFLYDWHEKNKQHKWHGFSHPRVASSNAQFFCHISKKEQTIIESHMWPLTFTKIPKCKEAILVCLFDKLAAIHEFLKK